MKQLFKFFLFLFVTLSGANFLLGMQQKDLQEHIIQDTKGQFLAFIHGSKIYVQNLEKEGLVTVAFDKALKFGGLAEGILFVVYEKNEVYLFDANTGSEIKCVQANKNRKIVCCAITEKIIRVTYDPDILDFFSIDTGKKLKTIRVSELLHFFEKEGPESRINYFVCKDHSIVVFDIKSGRCLATLQADKNKVIAGCGFILGLLAVRYEDNSCEGFDIHTERKFSAKRIPGKSNLVEFVLVEQ